MKLEEYGGYTFITNLVTGFTFIFNQPPIEMRASVRDAQKWVDARERPNPTREGGRDESTGN